MNALIGLMVGAALAVPAGEQKEAPKDLDKLQGIWKVTAASSRGAEVLPAAVPKAASTLIVVGDRYVFSTHAGTFTLDPAKGTVDFDVKAGRYQGKTVPGRYEFTGDSLKLIMPTSLLNPVRVPDVKPGEVPAGMSYTFERDGKATKEQAEALLKDRTAALPDKGVGVGGPGGGGFGGFGGAKGGAAAPAATLQMLERILERLERIEQRLDAMEKKLAAPREQK